MPDYGTIKAVLTPRLPRPFSARGMSGASVALFALTFAPLVAPPQAHELAELGAMLRGESQASAYVAAPAPAQAMLATPVVRDMRARDTSRVVETQAVLTNAALDIEMPEEAAPEAPTELEAVQIAAPSEAELMPEDPLEAVEEESQPLLEAEAVPEKS